MFSFDDDDLRPPDPGDVLGVEEELHMLTVSNGRARFLSKNEASDESDLDDVPELVNGKELGVPSSARNDSRLGSSYEVGIDNNYISSFAGQAGKSAKKMTPDEFEPSKFWAKARTERCFWSSRRVRADCLLRNNLKKLPWLWRKRRLSRPRLNVPF